MSQSSNDRKKRIFIAPEAKATSASGSSTKKSILQRQVGNKKSIYLCPLLSHKVETCALNLEFKEEDEAIFSVPFLQSIHRLGFFSGEYEEPTRDAYKSILYGEDISESESEDSSDCDSDEGFGDYFDEDIYPSAPVRNSGVVTEELEDDDKRATDNGAVKEGKTKKQLSASAKNNSERQLVVKRCYGPKVLELEDEDGLPLRCNYKNKSDSSSTKEKSTEVKGAGKR